MRRGWFRPTPLLRAVFFGLGDVLIWTGALWGAFMIRFDGDVPSTYLRQIPLLLVMLIPVKFFWHAVYRSYHLTWRSVGLSDLLGVVKANLLALLTLATLILLFRGPLRTFPRSILLLDFVLATVGVGGFRAARRVWETQRDTLRRRRNGRNGRRALIIGAGAAGTRIAQTLQESGDGAYRLVGFIDDDPGKHGAFILGLRVFGGEAVLSQVVREQGVEEVLIAMPSVPAERLREIVEHVRRTGLQQIKVLPGMHEWLAGRGALKEIREVNLNDLLRREPVRIQFDALRTYLAGKRVLVTGAAGSIGSELVRQLSRFDVAQVFAVDSSETGLFDLEQELTRELPGVPLTPAIGDIRDGARMEWLMATARPHLVFHAAAYKHVPMMERDVAEAVKTNVFGTLVVGEAALRHDVEAFVFISTDKAVNPVSVLGASKRLGELIMHALARRGRTRFLAVRFGNVLGSRGSIVPLLQEQIRRGGPVTITHPDMERYFMTIAEAVLLVLQTPLVASPGTVFMLDMGQPVRIVDLVRELIRLSGLEADTDIPIVYSGVRPGEKIEEELVALGEAQVPTPFDRILEVRTARTPIEDEVTLRLFLRELEEQARAVDTEGIRTVLRGLARVEEESPVTRRLGVSGAAGARSSLGG